MFSINGTLKVIMDTQKVSDRFQKRDFVIQENSSQYPQLITFQLTQDRCDVINGMNAGDEVRVHFNLRGREWKSPQGEIKYFNTIECWKLEVVSKGNVAAAPDVTTFTSGESDDLPF